MAKLRAYRQREVLRDRAAMLREAADVVAAAAAEANSALLVALADDLRGWADAIDPAGSIAEMPAPGRAGR